MDEKIVKQEKFNKAMALYENKKKYQIFSKVISTINVVGQIILIILLWKRNFEFHSHLISIVLAYVIADFWNGLVHMYMDNNDNYEGFFGPFVANFHLHHRTPLYKKKPVLLVYFDESGSKIWMAPLEIIVILLSTKIPTFMAFTFMYFFIFSSFAELSHYFCHAVDGKYINFMQKIKIILNKKHHAKHHVYDNMNYAFLNGVSDPLINVIAKKFYKGYKNGTDMHYENYKGNGSKNRQV